MVAGIKSERWPTSNRNPWPDCVGIRSGGRKRETNMRDALNAVMYVLSTGCQWRYLPKDLPPRSTVYRYFRDWGIDGVLDRIHDALYEKCREQAEREAGPTAAIIDSQSVKSAEKGGSRSIRTDSMQERRSTVRSVTFSSTPKVC
jgi:transposase